MYYMFKYIENVKYIIYVITMNSFAKNIFGLTITNLQ